MRWPLSKVEHGDSCEPLGDSCVGSSQWVGMPGPAYLGLGRPGEGAERAGSGAAGPGKARKTEVWELLLHSCRQGASLDSRKAWSVKIRRGFKMETKSRQLVEWRETLCVFCEDPSGSSDSVIYLILEMWGPQSLRRSIPSNMLPFCQGLIVS